MPRKGEFENLVGRKFNNLTVLELAGKKNKRYVWTCKCDCGNTTETSSEHLKSGHTKSCGCLCKEKIRTVNLKTGLTNTKLYYAYHNMKNRCYRESNDMFLMYGKRGITVCDEWMDKEHGFENFAKWSMDNGYLEGLTLDRKDNDKGYSPDNCRWVDKYVQANNKRNNRYIKINGEIDTVGNMARKYNVSYWNLLHYSKGGKNNKYPELKIEVANEL